MFTIHVLGSGSAGNAALVASEGCRLLVDAGLSAKQLDERLSRLNVTPAELDGVLLTHEHGDHTSSLEVLCRKYPDLAIYCTSPTGEALRYASKTETLKAHKNWRYFKNHREFSIGDIAINAFDVPHDAVDPVGFLFQNADGALGFLTDLGHVSASVVKRLESVTALAIETNYDTALLMEDQRRPWSTKQRIMSHHGHLSNDDAAIVVRDILSAGGGRLHQVVCGHLSRDCNQSELVLQTIRKHISVSPDAVLEIHCASQSEVSPSLSITRARAALAKQQDFFPHHQLDFDLAG